MPKCEKCDRDFETEQGLEHHNKAKHHEPKKGKKISKKQIRKIRNWTIFVVIVTLIIAGVYFLGTNSKSCKELPAKELILKSHSNLFSHIHPTLTIRIDDLPQAIPANIGIKNGVMSALHTHDPTGKLHIESPCSGRTQFTLGEFFEIWEQDLKKEGMGLRMLVNGKESFEFENYIMKDLDNIELEYTTNES